MTVPASLNLDTMPLARLGDLLLFSELTDVRADVEKVRKKYGLNFQLALNPRRFERDERTNAVHRGNALGWADRIAAVAAQLAYVQVFCVAGGNVNRMLFLYLSVGSSTAEDLEIGFDTVELVTPSAVVPQNLRFNDGGATGTGAVRVNSGNQAAVPATHKTILRQPKLANTPLELGGGGGGFLFELAPGTGLNIFAKTVNTDLVVTVHWAQQGTLLEYP